MTTETARSRPASAAASPAFGTQTFWRVLRYLIALVAAIAFAMPFLWTIGTSLKPLTDLYTFPPTFVPSTPRWQNYGDVFALAPFGRFLINSVIVTALAVFGQTFSTAIVAFGFTRFRFPGRNMLFFVVLATMMLPWHVTIVPSFLLFRYLGWIDTLLPLIVPSFFAVSAFSIFLLRQFFMTIPRDLDEAARIDGATSFHIFWRIILPLSKVALATVAIFAFIDHWNEFIGPLIYLNSTDLYTVSLGLRYFIVTPFEGDEPREAILMAASLIVALPPLVLFFAAQKYFVQGIVTTGMKG
ncbi:MAG TPA: carbohydrate ABC transporter permease [Roseiflexaceae bacterium]|jgi:ABC-type glycerol-3-phosphate transport system permease component|nr:carbohydrate ABC transporter permease [Roseiflexaceae bacterium]